MNTPLRIAASQFPVSGDIARNARYIRTQLKEGSASGAHVIHFPETALSGYAPKHFASLEGYPWGLLEEHTEAICALAASYGVWVVLGSMRPVPGTLPKNSVYVISDQGEVVGTYDKQRLTDADKEVFSVGKGPCVVDIRGFTCGFLICYDNCFPELYDAYRDRGVGLLFHSFYNAANSRATSIKDLMLANLRVRAADNQMWISASNSSRRYSPLSACVVRPDGSMVRARRHATSLIIDDYPNHSLGWTYNNRLV